MIIERRKGDWGGGGGGLVQVQAALRFTRPENQGFPEKAPTSMSWVNYSQLAPYKFEL
jgi:hypothetical protein